MKIVQSCWSKPICHNGINSVIGGWYNPIFFYMSWSLSCLTYLKYYNNIELVCDSKSKEILIDRMRLPYSNVTVILDELKDYHPDLWALGKVVAYSVQKEPFIHVDYDTYIWEKFPQRIEEAGLVAQHLENDYKHNDLFFADVVKAFRYIPNDILKYRVNSSVITEINAGVIGGNNIIFFKEYCNEAFKFVDSNRNFIENLRFKGMFNTIFEQYLFYCMCSNRNITISYLIEKDISSNFDGLADFHDIGRKTNFIHTVGFYKSYFEIGEQIAYRLYVEFPEYYDRIVNLYKKGVLKNDFS